MGSEMCIRDRLGDGSLVQSKSTRHSGSSGFGLQISAAPFHRCGRTEPEGIHHDHFGWSPRLFSSVRLQPSNDYFLATVHIDIDKVFLPL